MANQTIRPVIQTAEVMPRTLVIKSMPIPGGFAHGVYGAVDRRTEPNVWVASFFDQDEAAAWIEGSKHFGQMVKGGVVGAARTDSGEVPEATGGAAAGGVREVQGVSEGGAGSPVELPGQVQMSGGDEVVGGSDGASASVAATPVVEGEGNGRVRAQDEGGRGRVPDDLDSVQA